MEKVLFHGNNKTIEEIKMASLGAGFLEARTIETAYKYNIRSMLPQV